jgi:hypothetical protein
MDSTYNIAISIKSPEGLLEIGSFLLGTNTDFAYSTFNNLKGNVAISNDTIIRIDLIKKEEGSLPILLKTIGCTLNQYAENCKIIIRDLFTFFTLEK